MMHRGLPRALEAVIAAAGLLVLSPFLLVVCVAIFVLMGRPVFFRQVRLGQFGRGFVLYKFRTMRLADGAPITAQDDARITGLGRALRRTKLDELPQLWNVLRGDMALVGPRPELPKFVAAERSRWDRVLSVRPGLTDPTTLWLLNEEELLATVNGDRELFYVQSLMPRKLDGYEEYLETRTWRTDVQVILRTLRRLIVR